MAMAWQRTSAAEPIDSKKCLTSASICIPIPITINKACPLRGAQQTQCTFSGANGMSLTCVTGADTDVCNIITPYQPQTCSGACVANMTLSCSISYNKCSN